MKYSTTVAGNGTFVLQFLADNCSWIYLDDTLVGVQKDDWNVSSTWKYPVTLNGTHTLISSSGMVAARWRHVDFFAAPADECFGRERRAQPREVRVEQIT